MDIKTKIDKAKIALLAMQRYSWEQGVTMQAFFEMKEYETLFALAKEAAYRKIDDGRIAIMGNAQAVTDPCCTGEALLFAAKETGDEQLQEAYDGLLNWALNKAPRNSEGIIYHMIDSSQFWVDSLYMLPPFLAAAGHFEEALKQIDGYWKALFNKEKCLMSHMWDDDKKQFIRESFWGVGNGWTMAGLVRVIDLLPPNMSDDKKRLIEMATILIKSVSTYIRPDGLSHDVLDDKNSFIDTNLPQMLSYSIYRGIKSKWLDNDYKIQADICRIAAENKVDRFGLVQDSCGAPHFISAGVAPEAQAFFLLMENVAK